MRPCMADPNDPAPTASPPALPDASTTGEPAGAASDSARSGGATSLRTRTSSTFIGLFAGTVLLIMLIVFLLENTQRAKVTFFGATGHLPLGLALLLAALAGALILGLVGTARIAQLRRRVKRSSAP
jgi:uncharacterized integral membrane protein